MFDDLISWLNDAVSWVVDQVAIVFDTLWNFIIDFINMILSAIGGTISGLIDLLPTDTAAAFTDIPTVPLDGFVNFINWVLPMDTLAALLLILVANYILYFTIGRLLKALQVL